MKRYFPYLVVCSVFLAAALLAGNDARAQGVADVLSGELVESEVGDYAWYEIRDGETGVRLFLRQAVVGEERVRRRTAQWVETEIVPEVGYPVIYKMLLTGSASDPRNIHKLIVQEYPNEPQEMEVDASDAVPTPSPDERKLIGKETVPTEQGTVEADHYQVESPAGTVELWLNEQVKPLGIVQMRSPLGEMKLQRHGRGGSDGESSLGKRHGSLTPPDEEGSSGPSTNFSGRAGGRRE